MYMLRKGKTKIHNGIPTINIWRNRKKMHALKGRKQEGIEMHTISNNLIGQVHDYLP